MLPGASDDSKIEMVVFKPQASRRWKSYCQTIRDIAAELPAATVLSMQANGVNEISMRGWHAVRTDRHY
jgi:hypothetical protein